MKSSQDRNEGGKTSREVKVLKIESNSVQGASGLVKEDII